MTPRQTWAPAPAPRCVLNSKTDPLNHSGNLMKRNLITIALFAALSTSAMATGLNFGNTTNNDNSVTNKGGEGGKGGSAIAGAVAGAAAGAKASVNSKNTASASSGGNTQSVSVKVMLPRVCRSALPTLPLWLHRTGRASDLPLAASREWAQGFRSAPRSWTPAATPAMTCRPFSRWACTPPPWPVLARSLNWQRPWVRCARARPLRPSRHLSLATPETIPS